MSLTKYFLSLSMLLGLGLAANAQTWQEPGGSVHSSEARYVVSANTTGCSTDLDYTNPSASNAVYTYTGAGMTVEQGQSFDLHVTSAEYMVWCHAVVFVDWNCDYDFDDEGEELFKVGSDVDDSDAPSDLVQNGNPEVADFTRTITVPADAAVGTTRMRIQFTDAWHIKGVDHPDHSAMDAVDKGGVYDFDVTITEAAAPEPEPEPGQDGWEVVASNTMSGATESEVDQTGIDIPSNNFVGIFNTTASGAVLEGLQWCYGFQNTWQDYIYVSAQVPEDGTYKFSFRIRSEGDDSNPTIPLTFRYGTSRANSQLASDTYNVTNSDVIPGEEYESWELELTAGDYVFGMESGKPTSATKTTSFVGDFKLYKKGAAPVEQAPLLTWATPENGTIAVTVAGETVESGVEVATGTEVVVTFTPAEGYELETVTLGGEDATFLVSEENTLTFEMGETNVEIAATFTEIPVILSTLTWAAPENGTIAVTVAGETVESGAEVEAGTEVVATFTPAEGYELETVTLGGEDVTTDVVDGVLTFVMGEEDVELAATFSAVQPEYTWRVVDSDPMSGTDDSWDKSESFRGKWTTETGPSNGNGAVIDGYSYCMGAIATQSDDFIGHYVEVAQSGTYKVSFSARLDFNDGASSDASATVAIYYAEGVTMNNSESRLGDEFTKASEDVVINISNDLPATTVESQEVQLEAGTRYAFAVNVISNKNTPLSILYVGDFKLMKQVQAGEIETYTVTWAEPENGTLTVTADTGTLQSGATVEAGTSITVTATPDEGYELETLTVGGKTFTSGESYVVEANTEIVATFAEIPPTMYTVSWAEPENGTLTVTTDTGTLQSGATVEAGTSITVTATPDEGYELETLTVGGEAFTSGESYVVEANTEIVATFAEVPPTMYTVSWTADNCDITVETAEGTTVENGGEVAEGTELTITATAADGYELESLTVNGDDFENGTTWTVAGDVTIAATVRGTGLDEAMADGIYYDAASQTLYVGAAQTLSVYDVTGRKVVETAVDGTFDASALRGGIYIAVADGKIVKFRK